jgi:hypothetical protein
VDKALESAAQLPPVLTITGKLVALVSSVYIVAIHKMESSVVSCEAVEQEAAEVALVTIAASTAAVCRGLNEGVKLFQCKLAKRWKKLTMSKNFWY